MGQETARLLIADDDPTIRKVFSSNLLGNPSSRTWIFTSYSPAFVGRQDRRPDVLLILASGSDSFSIEKFNLSILSGSLAPTVIDSVSFV